MQDWAGHAALILGVCIALAPTLCAAGNSESADEPVDTDPVSSREYDFPETLDASGAVIADVIIVRNSIFDLTDPDENNFLYRLANKLHIETKSGVIAQQLLFRPGDPYAKRLLEESARLLRSNLYIQDATVKPLLNEDGTVDVHVKTSDTWTLHPKFSFSRAGGTNSTDIGLRDANFLGRGMAIEALYSSTVDRDSTWLRMVDKHLGNSWYDFRFLFADNSDGRTRSLSLGKPFYALDSTRANGVSYFEDERIDSYYDLGHKVGEYTHNTDTYEAFLGWSEGLVDGWARRYTAGMAYDAHRYVPVELGLYPGSPVPPDRKLIYPFVGIEWLQDEYEKTRNLDQLGRTEDRYLGTRVTARMGYASQALGSDRSAWLLDVGAQTFFGEIENRSLSLDANLATRIESGSAQDFYLEGNARYYSREGPERLFYAHLGTALGHNLDPDRAVYLGGDNGLRGYPLRYQTGDKRILVSLEKRYFTNWNPFHLFHVGGAVFFDAGRTWGDGPYVTTNRGWLRDVGVGLRLSSTKSGRGTMTHIDLAYPLDQDGDIDSLQILISTKRGF